MGIFLLKELAKEYGSTLIVVTHDMQIAADFNNQIFMKDGKDSNAANYAKAQQLSSSSSFTSNLMDDGVSNRNKKK